MHCGPVQPAAQVQVSGAEHVPPFSQVLLQIAVIITKMHNVNCQ